MGAVGTKGDAGFGIPLKTESLMTDIRFQPDLNEQLTLGAAKAHRSVVFSHYEYRNIKRGSQMPRGQVK